MDVSVVMSAYNKAWILPKVIESIIKQPEEVSREVIVIDDGSTDGTPHLPWGRWEESRVIYRRIKPDPKKQPRCCAVAINIGYRLARGKRIIEQCADVTHESPDTILRLCDQLVPGHFVCATVYDVDKSGNHKYTYCSPKCIRPDFLAAFWRKDIFAIGGQDEDFRLGAWEDRWRHQRLLHLPLSGTCCEEAIAYHHDHPRPNMSEWKTLMSQVYYRKMAEAKKTDNWTAPCGAWEYAE